MARPNMTSRAPAIAGPPTRTEQRRHSGQRPSTATRWWLAAAVSLLVAALAACGPSTPAGAPPAPRDVTATAIAGGVRLTWVDQSSNEDGFVILRKDAGVEGEPSDEVGMAAADEQSFDDFSTEEEGSYVYGVAAVNVVGRSDVALQSPADPVTPLPGIDVSLTFDGDGVVTIAGGGVRKVCVDDCVVSFAEGTEIELDAEDNEDAVFAGWAGACDGAGTCTLEVDEPLEVEARFRRHVLQLSLAGDTPVELTISPEDDFNTSKCTLHRGEECALAYGFAGPLMVSINAVKLDPQGQFLGFDGPCSTEQGSYCLVNVVGATSVAIEAIRPPIAQPMSYQLNEDNELSPNAANGLLANAEDSDDDELRAVLVSDSSNGQLELRANGSFTYQPNQDYNGSDSFQYLVRDAYGNETQTLTASLTIHPVNDPPVFTIAGDPDNTDVPLVPQTFPNFATGIGPGGGQDEKGQTLTFQVNPRPGGIPLLAGPSLSTSGTLSFTLLPGVVGSATYDVTLKDNGGTANGGQDTSAAQSFTITVGPRTLSVQTSGNGTVTANPASASGDYGYGTEVALSAVPTTNWAFGRWDGSCSGTATTCHLTMDTDHSVSARFDAFVSLAYDTNADKYNVTSVPPGIACDSWFDPNCRAAFPTNNQVTLQVSSGSYYFKGVACDPAQPQPGSACTFTVPGPITVTISNTPPQP